MVVSNLETVKKEIRSILISSKDGLSLTDFHKTCRELLGFQLPFREFGFTSDIDFLRSIPDVVQIDEDAYGSTKLRVVANETTAHILKLVQKQKTIKKTKPNIKVIKTYSPVSHNNETLRSKPFVPALLRSEVLSIVKNFPQGIGFDCLFTEYFSKFKKPLNFEYLGQNLEEKFKKFVLAAPEFELISKNNAVKLHCVKKECFNKVNDIAPNQTTVLPTSSDSFLNGKELSATLTVSSLVKENFDKVLKNFPGGLPAVHFPMFYEKFTGTPLDFQELGFMSLLELADALPEICIRTHSNKYNLGNCKLFHISHRKNVPSSLGSGNVFELQAACETNFFAKERVFSVGKVPAYFEFMLSKLPEVSQHESIPVYVSAVISPSLFWFQLHSPDMFTIKKLEQDLATLYNFSETCLKMADAHISIGSACVVFLQQFDQWYRALITAIPTVEDVIVSFVDYGDWEKVQRSAIYYLVQDFSSIPIQAFKAKLSSVTPKNPEYMWSDNAKRRFIELVHQPVLMAEINSVENECVSVFLCDSSGPDDIHINDVLVKEQFAEISVSPQPSKTNQTIVGNGLHRSESTQENSGAVCSSVDRSPRSYLKSISEPRKKLFIEKSEVQSMVELKNVRKVPLGDGYSIHIVVVKQEGYVSAEEVSNLLWNGRGGDTLANILKFKGDVIPTTSISLQKYPKLFDECVRKGVAEFRKNSGLSSLILYALSDVFRILISFGHPSVAVRETIYKEIQEFNPLSAIWRANDSAEDECVISNEEENNEFKKLCIYDLKNLLDGYRSKKSKLAKDFEQSHDTKYIKEIKSVENILMTLMARIEQIQHTFSTSTTE